MQQPRKSERSWYKRVKFGVISSWVLTTILTWLLQGWLLINTSSLIFAAVAGAFATAGVYALDQHIRYRKLHKIVDDDELLFAKINASKGGLAKNIHKEMLKDFLCHQGVMIRLIGGESVQSVPYRTQMILAKYFFLSHRKRFWATTLDGWHRFGERNDDYLSVMQNLSSDGSSFDGIPSKARIFVCTWTDFIRDLVGNPVNAERLVRLHLQWGPSGGVCPVRVLLIAQNDNYENFFKRLKSLLPATEFVVSDFMIVDSSSVYGREYPYSLAKVVSDVSNEEAVTLRQTIDTSTINQYEIAFKTLWDESFEIFKLAEKVAIASHFDPIWSGMRQALDILNAEFNGRVLRNFENDFRDVLSSLGEIIQNMTDNAVKNERYGEFIKRTMTGAEVIKCFADDFIKLEEQIIWAMDQADIKSKPRRFWDEWQENKVYKEFCNATEISKARDKRRLFVVNDGDIALLPSDAVGFIREHVKNGVQVGLITHANLWNVRGTGTTGAIRTPAALPVFGSDFIIVGDSCNNTLRQSCEAFGFEMASEQFNPSKISYDNLLLSDRIARLQQWFINVWEDKNTIRIRRLEEVDHVFGEKPNGEFLAGWCFSDSEIQFACRDGILICPSLDLTSACNLNCSYCFLGDEDNKHGKKDELSKQEYLEIIRNFRTGGAKTVNIVGAGEPMLDPAFKDVVSFISEQGMVPVIFTNGTRLLEGDGMGLFLFEKGATIVLKYNSGNKTIQDSVVGHEGYSSMRDKVLEQLIGTGFTIGRKGKPTRLGLDTIAFQGNINELPDIHRWCRNNNIFPITADYIPAGRTSNGLAPGTVDSDDVSLRGPSPAQREKLFQDLKEIDVSMGMKRSKYEAAYYCGSPCVQQLGLYVDIKGNIWPCVAKIQSMNHKGVVRQPLGNIRDSDISSVWKDHSICKEIRSNFIGRCHYKPLFNSQNSEGT
ncbi:MAG: radical SAM protein [Nitrospirae bacterium]|nr:radical SAM protein [Magnetococcales bacterium]HAT51448.1 hypothetical protein [Alphaproteobacteria bacterium]